VLCSAAHGAIDAAVETLFRSAPARRRPGSRPLRRRTSRDENQSRSRRLARLPSRASRLLPTRSLRSERRPRSGAATGLTSGSTGSWASPATRRCA